MARRGEAGPAASRAEPGGAGGWKGVELPLEAAPALGPEARRALSGPSEWPRGAGALPPAGGGRTGRGDRPGRDGRALFLFHFPWLGGRRAGGQAAAAAAAAG